MLLSIVGTVLDGGDVDMATKSILKTIHIKDRKSAVALVNALENAHGKAEKEVTMSRSYSEASKEDIQKMFGVQRDDGIQNR